MSKYFLQPFRLFLKIYSTRLTRRSGLEFFLIVTINIFFSSKTCVFNNLLGVEEMILEIASQMLKKLV